MTHFLIADRFHNRKQRCQDSLAFRSKKKDPLSLLRLFPAVIRGDVHSIRIGNKVNIQDNATIHATYQKSPTFIGNNVSIAHNAVIHGCTIKDNVLIGMGAIVLDNAIIESNTIVAAGSVVTKGTVVESGWVYAGIPAKKIKQMGEELLKGEVERIVNAYSMYASWYDEDKTDH